ncbi:MAG: cyclic pyranopterin monophosphate synthase MoaC, partial [Sulfolobales archaeon]
MSVRMVDIGAKSDVVRVARAEGLIKLSPSTVKLVVEGRVEKGDVFTVSKIAAISAVKKTPDILPLCHNVPITYVDVRFEVVGEDRIKVETVVKAVAKTGVEMEALVGTSVALLTIWDMVKKYEKDESGQYPHTRIEYVRVVE